MQPNTPVNVLVVDDSPRKIMALSAILESPDLTILAAHSGEEALRLLLRHEFAVLLLDVSMPVLDGIQTAEIIRQRVGTSQTPIIFITAYDSNECNVAQAYALGAVDFIFAPVVPEVLKAKVGVFVDLFRKTREVLGQRAELEQRVLDRTAALQAEVEERQRAERDLLANLHHLSTLSAVSQAIVEQADPTRALEEVLVVLKRGFTCDRVWLAQPVGPEGTFRLAFVAARAGHDLLASPEPLDDTLREWPGAATLQTLDVAVMPDGSQRPEAWRALGVQAQLAVSVRPRALDLQTGPARPWLLLLQQCSMPREWTVTETTLLKDVAMRVADAVTHMLVHRDLQQSGQRFRLMAELQPQMTWSCEPDGGLDYVNPQWCRFTGLTPADSLGWGWTRALHPEDGERSLPVWRDALRTGEPHELQQRFCRAQDGEWRWHITRASPMRDADGHIVKWYGTCTDIHDTRQVQEALQQSQESYRALVHSIDGIVWEVDARLDRVTFVSHQLERILGFPVQRWLDEPNLAQAQMNPADLQRRSEIQAQAIESGQATFEAEYRLQAADGRWLWLRDNTTIVRVAGSAVTLRGVTLDITDKKKAELRLAMQYSVSRLLTEHRAPQMAGTHVLEAICLGCDFEVGVLWQYVEDDELLCLGLRAGEEFQAFAQACVDVQPILRDGLPHLVRKHSNALWFPDLSEVDDRPPSLRVAASDACGIRSVVVVPVLVGTRLVGALELHSTQIHPRDEELLRILTGVGNQLGQAIQHHAAAEALRQREDELHLITDAVPALISYIGPDLRYRFHNRQSEEWYDLTAASLRGQHLRDTLGDQAFAQVEPVVKAALDGHELLFEGRFPHRSGQRDVRAHYMPHRGHDGSIAGVIALVYDITDQKDAQAELKRSKDQLRIILHGVADAILAQEPSGKLVYANAEAVRLFCLEDLGDDGGMVSHFRDRFDLQFEDEPVSGTALRRDSFHNMPAVVALGGRPTQGAFRLRDREQGQERWVIQRATPVFTPEGEVQLVISITQDVTELKAAERALQESRDRLSLIYQNITELVTLYDVVGEDSYRIASVNAAVEAMRGELAADVVGRRLDEWLPEHVAREWHEQFRAALRSRGQVQFESDLSTPIRPQINEVRVLAIPGADGECRHLLSVARDITAKKRAEEALRLTEEQFRQSQKMEAVGRLAGGVAHDFNNLLTAINGYTDMLLDEMPEDNSEWRGFLQEVRNAGDRAASLTRQLLAYSRKQVLAPKVVSLNSIVGEMDRMLRRVIGEDIELVTRLQPDLAAVQVDPNQMQQVLLNLVVNARDAMPRGGRLLIETGNVDHLPTGQLPEGETRAPHVCMTVTDTGKGMDLAVQQHLFEPFFTTKKVGEGTGLGLSTVYGIVQQSGGFITVESAPEQGARFLMYLPALPHPETASREPPPRRELPRGQETLLVVEDEEAVRRLVVVVLRGAGYQVIEARDGHDALRVSGLHPGAIHLLLTDVVMPVMGGRQLAERIQELRPETRVVFMSGHTDDAVVRHGIREANTRFLQKPFTPARIAEVVREALDLPVGPRTMPSGVLPRVPLHLTD